MRELRQSPALEADRNGRSATPGRHRIQRVIILAALIPCVGIMLPVVRYLVTYPPYNSRARKVRELLKSLQSRCPRGVPPQNWEEGVNWTVTAECNVFFSPSHASRARLDQFGRDLEDRLRGPVGLDTLEWIWDQFADSGTAGRDYVERFRPSMREAIRPAPAPTVTPPQTKPGP